MSVNLEPSWLAILNEEFEKPYFKKIKQFLLTEEEQGELIYPKKKRYFQGF